MLPDTMPTVPPLPSGAPVDAQIKVIKSLYEVAVAPSEGLNTALIQMAEAVTVAFRVEYATIHLHEDLAQLTRIVAEHPARGFSDRAFHFSEMPVPAYFMNDPAAPSLILNEVRQPGALLGQDWPFFVEAGIKSALIVPLRVKETLVGSMHLMMHSHARPFSTISVPFAQIVANLAAVSIQNGRLAAILHTQIDQAEQIAAFGRRMMATQDQGLIIREAALLIRQYITVDGISVALHWQGEPMLRLHLVEGDRLLPPISLAYEQAWLRYAYENRMPLVLNQLSGGTQLDYEALIHHAPPDSWNEDTLAQTALIIPLIAGGQPIGTLNLTRQQPYSFTPDDLTLAGQIGAQLAVALENVRLFAQTADQLRSERLRAQLGGRIGRTTTERVDEILITTLQQVGLALGAQRARVRLSPSLPAIAADQNGERNS